MNKMKELQEKRLVLEDIRREHIKESKYLDCKYSPEEIAENRRALRVIQQRILRFRHKDTGREALLTHEYNEASEVKRIVSRIKCHKGSPPNSVMHSSKVAQAKLIAFHYPKQDRETKARSRKTLSVLEREIKHLEAVLFRSRTDYQSYKGVNIDG